jgi:putative PIN family toxin of toxin-antitoxin system
VIRAVLDANVFVSALIRPEGPPGQILVELLERESFRLILSIGIVDEVRRTLADPRVTRYVRLTSREIEAWLASLQSVAELVEGRRSVRVVASDPDDDKYFVAAVEGDADVVVSGDKHVLEVKEFERIRVLTPRAFLNKLRI